MHHPESLMVQVLRAKYYPNQDFLSASLGRNPSFAWRSIFNARSLLQEGLIWRVGNGASIRIWHDKWTPHPSTFMIQSPVRVLTQDARVCDLINDTTHTWNFPLIREIFWPEEALRICNLPLSPTGQPDIMVWRGSTNGLFSVRSAYHLEKERLIRLQGESSRASQQHSVWKRLWSMNVPGVVKTFIWRVCNNALPTRDNLYKKNIILSPLCPICDLAT